MNPKNERNAGRPKVKDGVKLIITVPKFNKAKIIELIKPLIIYEK
jgi:hypothetical protein